MTTATPEVAVVGFFVLDTLSPCCYYSCNILTRGVIGMTKKDIVLKITDQTGIKQVDVKRIVQKTFDVIVDALDRNEKVELRNFGVFKVKERRARLGRNPRTGDSVPVPPRRVVVFKAGLEMKQKIK